MDIKQLWAEYSDVMATCEYSNNTQQSNYPLVRVRHIPLMPQYVALGEMEDRRTKGVKVLVHRLMVG